MAKKKTAGELVQEVNKNKYDDDTPVGDQVSRSTDRHLEDLEKAIELGQKNIKGDFFVEIRCKEFKSLEKLYLYKPFVRRTCPYPDFDQTVYHYDSKRGEVIFRWTIPGKKQSRTFLKIFPDIKAEDYDLFEMLVAYKQGYLHEMADDLNNGGSGNIQARVTNIIKDKQIFA